MPEPAAGGDAGRGRHDDEPRRLEQLGQRVDGAVGAPGMIPDPHTALDADGDLD